MKTPVTLIIVAYLIGAFSTFGYVWNHNSGQACFTADGKQVCFEDYNGRAFGSLLSGLGWPVYWLGLVAIKATA